MYAENDTIYALSSGSLPSGVAVVRVSGPKAHEACTLLAGAVPPLRQAVVKTLRTSDKVKIDDALVLAFAAPFSFTGEDCIEFQTHGGRAVVQLLMKELSSLAGFRHAAAGEFSRRAFENGKLDLVEIEGLADLISAETEMQRRLAIEQSSGLLSGLYDAWSMRLTRARALIEAELDFSDEEDVPGSVSDTVWADMNALHRDMVDHLSGFRVGEIIRDGFRIAIVGPPNAGKSSLLNRLAKRDIAIVTDIAGTTRDVLEVDLDIGGYLVRLYDTAGIRQTDEVVEKEGIRRAALTMRSADLILVLTEVGQQPDISALDLPSDKPALRLQTKSDLAASDALLPSDWDVAVSVKSDGGLTELSARILATIESRVSIASTSVPSRLRQASHIEEAIAFLNQARSLTEVGLDIRAEYLRSAGYALGRITGQTDVESLLGVIFSEFCVGK